MANVPNENVTLPGTDDAVSLGIRLWHGGPSPSPGASPAKGKYPSPKDVLLHSRTGSVHCPCFTGQHLGGVYPLLWAGILSSSLVLNSLGEQKLQLWIKCHYLSFIKWLFFVQWSVIRCSMDKEAEVFAGLTVLRNLWELEFGLDSSKTHAIVTETLKSIICLSLLAATSPKTACPVWGGGSNKL